MVRCRMVRSGWSGAGLARVVGDVPGTFLGGDGVADRCGDALQCLQHELVGVTDPSGTIGRAGSGFLYKVLDS